MRRKLIKTMGALVAVALVAGLAPPATAGELDGVTLRVGSWGGSWQKIQRELIATKLEAMGAKVEFVKGNPSANLAKLIAARGAEPVGGLAAVVDALLERCAELGVQLHLGATPERIHTADAGTTGVELEGGERLETRLVLSALDPIVTLQELAVAKYEMEFFHKLAAIWTKSPRAWTVFPEFLRAVYAQRIRVESTADSADDPHTLPFPIADAEPLTKAA